MSGLGRPAGSASSGTTTWTVAASPAAKSSRRMSCVSRTSAPGASTRSSGRSEPDAEERRAEQQQQGDHGRRHRDRPAHHEHGDAVPDALAVDDRATLEHAALVDPMAEGGEHRRQQHDGAERRRRRHADAGVAERAHERDREHEHRRQPDRHGDGAEQDRPAGRAHRAHDGDPGLVAAGQLLAVAGDDEQAVVDRQAEAQRRRGVEREDRHVGELGEQLQHGERADDREDADGQRQQGGDDRAEHPDQQHERDRDGDHLGESAGPARSCG